MKISIVMPIYLGFYPTAARDRNLKLFRAINSVVSQKTNHDFELICIVDSCKIAKSLIEKYYEKNEIPKNVFFYYLNYEKPKTFNACKARNAGIDKATGEVICYLDCDDYISDNFVDFIGNRFSGDWVYFDDMMFNGKNFYSHKVRIPNDSSTCNIAHSRSLTVRWEIPTYGQDDKIFIKSLLKISDGKYIGQGGYYVCHWPGSPKKYDI